MNRFNPWLHIWVKPRETIRYFLESPSPERGFVWIGAVAGIGNGLDQASQRNWLDNGDMFRVLIGSMIGGAIGGLLATLVAAFFLKAVGSWIGGVGTSADLRVALTRGINAPAILIGLLWIPELLLFGNEMFTKETPRIDQSALLTALHILFTLVEVILSVWMCVVGLKAIGEAHRFSAWKALSSVLILMAIFLGIVFVITFFISVFF